MNNKEETNTEQPETRWFIALDWFPQNNRSVSALIQGCLCPRCAQRLSEKDKVASPEAIMSAIKDCCSQATGFINDRLPILESIFRVFLANGNQPLDLEELGKRLSEWRSGDPYRTSPETLLRLLKNDRYYGLREAKD